MEPIKKELTEKKTTEKESFWCYAVIVFTIYFAIILAAQIFGAEDFAEKIHTFVVQLVFGIILWSGMIIFPIAFILFLFARLRPRR